MDGRSNRRNKATFSNFSGVVGTLLQTPSKLPLNKFTSYVKITIAVMKNSTKVAGESTNEKATASTKSVELALTKQTTFVIALHSLTISAENSVVNQNMV